MSATCSKICVGPQRFLVARATRSSSPSAAAERPRATRRVRSVASLMGRLRRTALGEIVVGIEAVRVNDLVAHARVVVQRDDHDGLLTVGAPALIKDVRNGFGAERAA